MSAKQKATNRNQHQAAEIANLLYRLADKSCEMEYARYDSLLRQSGYLLTGISIVSIALLTAVGAIASLEGEFICPIICYCATISSVIAQAVALVFALCSQFRYRYKQLNPPEKLRKYCDDLYSQMGKESQCDAAYKSARNYADSLQEHYTSIKERNDRICMLNRNASIALLVSVSLALFDVLAFTITFKAIS